MKLILNDKLQKIMKDDIERCRQSPREGSQWLYDEMIARYSSIFLNFKDSLPTGGKIAGIGLEPDYRRELNAISTKLETLLSNDNSSNVGSGNDSIQSNKIFIVHGHNDALKSKVARLIESLGLEAIILNEQPSGGQTIIEKLEKYSDVSFAIILYTGCDEGKTKTEVELKPRARQNVVFEHGYMIAKLGRNRVCAIKESGVEIPGDIDGVVYIDYDKNGKWKFDVTGELQKAGFKVSKDSIK